MNIVPFEGGASFGDLSVLFESRFHGSLVMWPDQAVPLLAYMAYPNDEAQRNSFVDRLLAWKEVGEDEKVVYPKGLSRLQRDWLRVADVFHLYVDLVTNDYRDRGGPSIGKAIALAENNARERGTGASALWELWSNYKDVAHLLTSASLVCAEAQTRYNQKLIGLPPRGLGQFSPFQMAFLMPDLVMAAAMDFEQFGLGLRGTEPNAPVFDVSTVWRVPDNLGLEPIASPRRALRTQDLALLEERRAGNRGRQASKGSIAGNP